MRLKNILAVGGVVTALLAASEGYLAVKHNNEEADKMKLRTLNLERIIEKCMDTGCQSCTDGIKEMGEYD